MHKDPTNRRLRDRRLFLKAGSVMAASAALSHKPTFAQEEDDSPDSQTQKYSVGIMGLNGRGGALAKTALSIDGVEVSHICDVDENVLKSAGRVIQEMQGKAPKTHGDIRRMLDEKSMDAVFIAAPNHWHAPATIMACNAGKHVYCEKPCSHNPAEGEWAVQAARKNQVVVQTGTQRRSWSAIQEGIKRIHDGVLGNVLYARCWYNNRRTSIGIGKEVEPPNRLDWDLWQGPAPRTAFKTNYVPYNWHWHWLWGNGELGNNGVHGIDLARWGLQVAYPMRVVAAGGKYRHNDSQETPDTLTVGFDFAKQKTITWEGLSWSPLGPHDARFGISFHGTEGSMVMRTAGYTLFDMKDKAVDVVEGKADDRAHIQNFLDCIESRTLPNADIQIGHDSALLCHLGNIAYRTESVLKTDPANGHILENSVAQEFWEREYEPNWNPKTNA